MISARQLRSQRQGRAKPQFHIDRLVFYVFLCLFSVSPNMNFWSGSSSLVFSTSTSPPFIQFAEGVAVPATYNLDSMKGKWFPTYINDVRYNDPYQYFLFDASTSVAKGQALMTHDQAVAACASIGATLLSNINYKNLGFGGMNSDVGIAGVDESAAIWFGLRRRMPKYNDSSADIIATEDGRSVLNFPDDGTKLPTGFMNAQSLNSYYADTGALSSATNYSCYTLKSIAEGQTGMKARLRPVSCGGVPTTMLVTVAVAAPENITANSSIPPDGYFETRNVTIMSYHYALTVCQRPYVDITTNYTYVSNDTNGSYTSRTGYIRLAPQARWHRNEVPLRVAPTSRDDFQPFRPPATGAIIASNQPVDHVLNTIELFVSTLQVLSTTGTQALAVQLCAQMDADLAVIPSVEYAMNVVFPAIASLHAEVALWNASSQPTYLYGCYGGNATYERVYTLEETSLASVGFNRSSNAFTTAYGAGGTPFCQLPSVLRGRTAGDWSSIIGTQWGKVPLRESSATSIGQFYTESLSMSSADSVFGLKRSSCAGVSCLYQKVLCSRQLMRVTAELIDGHDLIAGSTARVRLTISHVLPTLGPVSVAITSSSSNISFSTYTVSFTNELATPADIGFYIPSSSSGSFYIHCHILGPIGAGIQPVVRWIRSRRARSTFTATSALNGVTIATPLLVTFSPSGVDMNKDETQTVTATLNQPSNGDFVIAPDFQNAFVSATAFIIPKGNLSASFLVKAISVTAGVYERLNYTGIPLVAQPIFGAPSDAFFYTQDANVYSPSVGGSTLGRFQLSIKVTDSVVLRWNNAENVIYDGFDDGLEAPLNLTKGRAEPLTVFYQTNCTPYVTFLYPNVTFAALSVTTSNQNIKIQRRVYHSEVWCSLVVTSTSPSVAMPAPLIFTIRKRANYHIVRQPTQSFNGDGATISLRLDRFWGLALTLMFNFGGPGSCATMGNRSWIIGSSPSSWTFDIVLPDGPTNYVNCSVTPVVGLVGNPFFNRRTFLNATEFTPLANFSRFTNITGIGSAVPKASINRLNGDSREMFPQTQIEFMVWMPEDNVQPVMNFQQTFTDPTQTAVYANSKKGSFCLNITLASSFIQNYQLVPIYNASVRMYYSYFMFSATNVGIHQIAAYACQAVTNYANTLADLGRGSIEIKAVPTVGMLVAAVDGSMTTAIPSSALRNSALTLYFFPTASIPLNASGVTITVITIPGSTVATSFNGLNSTIPSITIPIGSASVSISVTQDRTGASTWCVPFGLKTIVNSASVLPTLSLVWGASSTYDGNSYNTSFCVSLTNAGGPLLVDVVVVPYFTVDLVALENSTSRFNIAASAAITICVKVISVRTSFSLVATPTADGYISVPIDFVVARPLRFLRAVPVTGFSRPLVISRWPSQAAKKLSFEANETLLVTGSSGLAIRLESYGESAAKEFNVSTSVQLPYTDYKSFFRTTQFTVFAPDDTSEIMILDPSPYSHSTSSLNVINLCATNVTNLNNCQELLVLDLPSIMSSSCLIRAEGYVPSLYGGRSSVAGLDPIPYASFWSLSNTTNGAALNRGVGSGPPLPPLLLTSSSTSIADMNGFSLPFDAMYDEVGFSIQPPVSSLLGGDGGEPVSIPPPYPFAKGWNIDPTTDALLTMTATKQDVYGQRTIGYSCDSQTSLWAAPAYVPAFNSFNTSMVVGDRGVQDCHVFVATPPWYSSEQQAQRPIRMNITVRGINASTVVISPNSFLLYANRTKAVLSSMQSIAGAVDPRLDLNSFKFRLSSASYYGAAQLSLRVTFDPPSPYYADYTHTDNITILPLLIFDGKYDSDRSIFGCFDYILANYSLTPVPARPIDMRVQLNQSMATVGITPTSVSNPMTLVNFTSPNCSLLTGVSPVYTSINIATSGLNALLYSLPPSSVFALRSKLAITLSIPPNDFYVELDNAIAIILAVERLPKPGRRLTLLVNCINLGTSNGDTCWLNRTNTAFESTTTSLSVPIGFYVTSAGQYQVWLTAVDWRAPEFLPITSNFTVTAVSKKATTVTITNDTQYTHLPVGKIFNLQVRNTNLISTESMSIRVSMNTSGAGSMTLNGFTQATHTFTLSSATNTVNIILRALSVPRPVPVKFTFTVQSVSSPTIDTTTQSLVVVIVPQLEVNFTATSLFYYLNTTNENLVSFGAPLPYNRLTIGEPFGPILRASFFVNASNKTAYQNFTGTFANTPQTLDLDSNDLTLLAAARQTMDTPFKICWNRSADSATPYSFEYLDIYTVPKCLEFVTYPQVAITATMSYNWYLGDTLEVNFQAPVADLNRCKMGTTVEVTTTNPDLRFNWTRTETDFAPTSNSSNRVVNMNLKSLILMNTSTSGIQAFNWSVGGSCYNFLRQGNVSWFRTSYRVNAPSQAIIKGFPKIMFINDTRSFSVTTSVLDFHDGSDGPTQFNITWTGGGTPAAALDIEAGSSANFSKVVGATNRYIARIPKVNDFVLNFTIKAREAQTGYATWNYSVMPFRDRYINGTALYPIAFNDNNSFIIPPIQNFNMSSLLPSVHSAVNIPYPANRTVFYGEDFCILVGRSPLTYNVTLNVTVVVNSTTLNITSPSVRPYGPSVLNQSVCFLVLSAQSDLAPIQFIVRQSNNLYNLIRNATLVISPPTIVSIKNGTFAQLICGPENSRLIELIPAKAPRRDNVLLNVTVSGAKIQTQTFKMNWTTTDTQLSRFINLSIPCGQAGDSFVRIEQIFSSKEFASATGEGLFTFTLKPKGSFKIVNVRQRLFEAQDSILVVTPSQAPVQYPLTVTIAAAGVVVDPSTLKWAIGDASPRQVEFFGVSNQLSMIILRTTPTNEYNSTVSCYGSTAQLMPNCTFEVVSNARIASKSTKVVVFVGYPQTFELEVRQCADNSVVSINLSPFEFSNAITISPSTFNFTCRGDRSIANLPTIEVRAQNIGNVVGQQTQVLVVASQIVSGATEFRNVDSLGLNIEVRTPATITADVSSGDSIFVGQVTTITITLPRLPSQGSVNVTATVDNTNISTAGLPVTWSSNSAQDELSLSISITLVDRNQIAGTTIVTLTIGGSAASEYFFDASANTGGGPYSPSVISKALTRRMPFQVNGTIASSLRWGRHTQNISYPYNISLQQAPTLIREQIIAQITFTHTTDFRFVYSYNTSFGVNESKKSFSFILPVSGNYTISGEVFGSDSYAKVISIVQTIIAINPLLAVTADAPYPTQYVNVGQLNIQSMTVYIPPMYEPNYRVTIKAYWDSSTVAACGAASAELLATTFTYVNSPTGVEPTKTQTRLSIYSRTSGVRCRLLIAVSGSKEFATSNVLVGSVEFLPLRYILTPAVTEFQIMVGSQFTFMVNVSALPPVGITYSIEATSKSDSGVLVTPSRQNITNTTNPYVIFTISSSMEGTAGFPFKCVPYGNDTIYSFDLNRQLDVVVKTLSLLEATFSYNSIVYTPISDTSSVSPKPIDVYVESANTVSLSVIFPAFAKFNSPPNLRAYASTSNGTYLTASFTTAVTSEPSLTLTPDLTYPYTAQLSLVGALPTLSADATKEVELQIRINSTTQEYKHLSRLRVIVRPLFYLTISASFQTLYSGSLNAGSLRVKPNCSEWPELLKGKILYLELTTSCNFLTFDRFRSFSSCSAQDLAISATAGGQCTVEVKQLASSRLSLFTSDSATLPIEVVAQADLSYLLYVNGKLVDGSAGITAEQVRTQGITIRLFSSGIGFATSIVVTPFNESSVTVASTQPRYVYRALEDGETYKTSNTGFWRSLTTAMDIPLDNDGSNRSSYYDLAGQMAENSNRSTIRWSISSTQEQNEVTIQVAPLPTYSTDREEIITIKCKRAAFIGSAYPNPLRDTISFRILAPEVSAALASKKETTANTVLGGAAVSAPMSFYSAASVITVLTSVTLSRCPSTSWRDSQDTMELFLFPFRTAMPFLVIGDGSADDLGVYAGAIVGNTMLIVGVILLHAILIFIVQWLGLYDKLSLPDLLGLMRFPSLCWFPIAVLYSPTVVASARVVLYSTSPSIKVLGSLSLLVYAIILPGLAILLSVKSQKLVYTTPNRHGVVDWLINVGHFKHPTDPYWVGRYAEVILPLRGEVRWWFAADFIVMTFISFAVAVMPETSGQCLVRNILICLIFFGIFFAILLVQPMSRKGDNFFFAIVALLHAIAVSIAISQTNSGSSSSSGDEETANNAGGTTTSTTTSAAATTIEPASSLTTISNAASDFFGSTDKDLLVQNLLLAAAILMIIHAAFHWLQTLRLWATLCSSLHRASAHDELFTNSHEQSDQRNVKNRNRQKDAEADEPNAKQSSRKPMDAQKQRKIRRLERMRALHMSEALLTHDSEEDEMDTDSSEEAGYHRRNNGGDSTSSSSEDYGYDRRRKAGRRSRKGQSYYGEEVGVEPLDDQTSARLQAMGDEALATMYDIDMPSSPNAPSTGRRVVKLKGFQRAFDPTVIAFDPLARQALEFNSGHYSNSDPQPEINLPRRGGRGVSYHYTPLQPLVLPQQEYVEEDEADDGPSLKNWSGDYYEHLDATRL